MQDLLLIQDIVGVLPPPSHEKSEDGASDASSEDEIEDELMKGSPTVSSSESGTDSDSDSDSDISISESVGESSKIKKALDLQEPDIDENIPATAPGQYFSTKNEVLEPHIRVPTIKQVDSDTLLHPVGEIMTIIDNSVVVKAVISAAHESPLDTDTLLVFDDRSVLGYIYDTFGPTSHPLYQVKFSTEFPLDPDHVQLARRIFHLPQHSQYISVSQLRRQKGSDASNLHDEEPADHELEFSDDEAEAASRSKLKKKRRGESATPSTSNQQPKPTETFSGPTPFDAHSFYDIDYTPGASSSSQPITLSYDDPYAEAGQGVQNTQEPLPSRPLSQEMSTYRPPRRSRGHLSRGSGRGRRMPAPTNQGSHDSRQIPNMNPSYPQFNPAAPQNMSVQPHINPLFMAQFGLPYGFNPSGSQGNGSGPHGFQG